MTLYGTGISGGVYHPARRAEPNERISGAAGAATSYNCGTPREALLLGAAARAEAAACCKLA